ncbi:MAG TPA: OmpA family protein [Phycisphaerae bacterium]|nr:OmpA family protein [Phycisphaerae bacterium]HOJ74607.1 OmpA family protein [Phycisphaerae bacterium]HOM50506.1 OmpA family protein [Phycisphaerae bacterium]HON65975.1 OmpA family protein [Phycisphaerae bacterium]HPP28279.1 OmpA family protein [Phycisphaerae bacterium]
MQRALRNLSLVAVLGLSGVLIGCNDPNKDVARADDSAQRLADRISQLEAELDAAQRQRNADAAEIERLKRELAEARAKQVEAPKDWHGVPGGAMTSVEGTLLFDSGKADLKPGAKQILSKIAATIRQEYPEREIYVFGHTDSDPIRYSKWKDNYELSCQRALTVVRVLQADGLANYMAACGWGPNKPKSDETSPQGKQANRRVEIYAMVPQAN